MPKYIITYNRHAYASCTISHRIAGSPSEAIDNLTKQCHWTWQPLRCDSETGGKKWLQAKINPEKSHTRQFYMLVKEVTP